MENQFEIKQERVSDDLPISTFMYAARHINYIQRCIDQEFIHHLVEPSELSTRNYKQVPFHQWLLSTHCTIQKQAEDALELAPFRLEGDSIINEWMALKIEEEMIEVFLAYEKYLNIVYRTLRKQLPLHTTRKAFMELMCEISDFLFILNMDENLLVGPPVDWVKGADVATNNLRLSITSLFPHLTGYFMNSVLTSLDIFAIFMSSNSEMWYRLMLDYKSVLSPKHFGRLHIIKEHCSTIDDISSILFKNANTMAGYLITVLEDRGFRQNEREIILPQYK